MLWINSLTIHVEFLSADIISDGNGDTIIVLFILVRIDCCEMLICFPDL